MSNEADGKELEKYLSDITTIKKLMTKYEEQSIIENWAFFTWGALIIISTFLHFFVASPPGGPVRFHYLYIWLPCLIIGGTFESIAWLRLIKKTDAILGSRRLIKIYISMILNLIAIIFIFVYSLQQTHHNPGLIILCFSCAMTFIAHASFGSIFIEAGITLLIGMFLILFDGGGWGMNFFAGIYIGIMMFVMGIHSYRLESQNRK